MNEGATGTLRILRQLNKYEFAVEIRVMREGLNNNKWDYRNLKEHYKTFLGQPILIAYVGSKIGDGHNMRSVMMPDGGIEYTFVDGTAERIIGTLSDREEDFRLEEADGNLWMIAKGRIFRFYAREAVEKIIATGAMAVSAETEIFKTETGAEGVEIFEDWAGLGVTILGDNVPPAIPGARIKAMSVRDDLEGMKLRAASLQKQEETEETPRSKVKGKGVKYRMNKREFARLSEKFPGYTVLGASKDGLRVCMVNAETGAPSGYVFTDENDKGGVVNERICAMSANVQFAFDAENVVDVDLEKVTDTMIAALAEANKKAKTMEEKVAALEEQVKNMEAHETSRRMSDAKKAVMNRLDALNKDRDARCLYSKDLADALCAKIETGCFNEAKDEKGEWCGDQLAVMELEAKCAQEQEKMDKAAAEKAKKAVIWNAFADEAKTDPNSIDALLAYAKQ